MKINKKCLYTFLAISILLFTSCDKNSVNNSLEINIDKNTQVTEIKLYGLYTVSQVVDGDTITVDIDGKNEKVRLIGKSNIKYYKMYSYNWNVKQALCLIFKYMEY